MSPIQWSAALAVGVPEIDAQHQELFRRAQRFVAALRAGEHADLESLIHYLGDYAVEHFAAEERYMQEIGFPDLEGHRAAHLAFREDFAAMVEEFEHEGATPALALMLHNWLSDWLRRHVGGLDVEIGRFAAARQAR